MVLQGWRSRQAGLVRGPHATEQQMNTETCILHVEDDPNDVYLQQYAFERAGVSLPIQVVASGQHAMDYLSGTAPYTDRTKYPLPCLMLLDLKLPGVCGLDVLQWIRAQRGFRALVVIVLTSSKEPGDVQRAYELGANSFLVKPLELTARVEMTRALKSWWLERNHFPALGEDCLRWVTAMAA